MKILKDILYKVSITSVYGHTDVEVSSIISNSKKVEHGSLFIAIKGTQFDGHAFIEKAIKMGAVAILCETLPKAYFDYTSDITFVTVQDTNEALGIVAANYFDNPSEKMKLVGITGTNGKTTCVTLLHSLILKMGNKGGLISTIENKIGEAIYPATHTTPDPIQLNMLLNQMVQENCTFCFMEVSSHAIVQKRIAGLKFSGAVFTNITHDHLDYHLNFQNYINAKKAFFDSLSKHAFSLINEDDKHGKIMLQNCAAQQYGYSLTTLTNFHAKLIENSIEGLHVEINRQQVWFPLNGKFNAYNLLAVYATASLLGFDSLEILKLLSGMGSVRGRFEKVVSKNSVIGIIDYAHTPDALSNVLDTIQEIRKGTEKIITVVGCGGNRDVTKRPVMANIACKKSDQVILTSDNPRSEDPHKILSDMNGGLTNGEQGKAITIADRREAIKAACSLAKSGDIILIAGKGHETYQEICGVKHDFDDREVLINMFDLLEIRN